ncbi:MAG: AMP-binding protein [Cytophagales bacterium]|nr:AMP-binding protein [Cytophagales bacterium]
MEHLDHNTIRYFYQAAAKHPNRPAIIEKDRRITFDELADEVRDAAERLQSAGIRPGDRVLVFVPISIDLYTTVLALFHCGAVAVFAEEWADRKKLAEYLQIAKCKAIISTKKILFLASLLSKSIRKIPLKINIPSFTVLRLPFTVKIVSPDKSKPHDREVTVNGERQTLSEEEALVTFTTGSTGTPKAANRTHGFLRQQLDALLPVIYGEQAALETLAVADDDVDMTLLPIVLLINLAIGRTSVLADFNPRKPQTFEPAVVWQQIEQQRVTSFTAAPYYVEKFANFCLKRTATTSIRKIFCGGSSIFPASAQTISRAFPKAEIHFIYGSTEAEPIAHLTATDLIRQHPDLRLHKGLCVGKPAESLAVSIVSLQSKLTANCNETEFENARCAVGEIGEICVHGPHVLQRYLNHEQVMRDNKYRLNDEVIWHRTGDAGYLDENGLLYLTGRCREIIRWEGSDYYPLVFENNVQQWLPGVEATLLSVDNQPYVVVAPDENRKAVLGIFREKSPEMATWPVVFSGECHLKNSTPVPSPAERGVSCDELSSLSQTCLYERRF